MEQHMASVAVGDRAPDFSLLSQIGAQVALADYRGAKAVEPLCSPKKESA
jgi:hypothetical protein